MTGWLYFVVRSSDRAAPVVDVDLPTAGREREIAGRRGKGQCTVSRGPAVGTPLNTYIYRPVSQQSISSPSLK